MSKFLVQMVQEKETGRGSKYLFMQLFEPGGRLWKAVFWEKKELKQGQIIDALYETTEFNGEPQLKIKAFNVINEDVSDLFLPKTKQNVDDLYLELQGHVERVELINLGLGTLLRLAIADKNLWQRTPAATAMHHAFLGGLLEHTVNLCKLAINIQKLYPVLRLELLLTACILHDIGKTQEIACGVNLEYTVVGELLGHVEIGLEMVNEWMRQLTTEELSHGTRLIVKHLIASHHGNMAYGAIRPPMLLEAQVFNMLDGLDATLGNMLATIEKAPKDATWTEKAKGPGQRLYLGERT